MKTLDNNDRIELIQLTQRRLGLTELIKNIDHNRYRLIYNKAILCLNETNASYNILWLKIKEKYGYTEISDFDLIIDNKFSTISEKEKVIDLDLTEF